MLGSLCNEQKTIKGSIDLDYSYDHLNLTILKTVWKGEKLSANGESKVSYDI